MLVTNSNAKEIQLVAIITRANGQVEHLGVVDYWHKNPFKRLMWKIKRLLERK